MSASSHRDIQVYLVPCLALPYNAIDTMVLLILSEIIDSDMKLWFCVWKQYLSMIHIARYLYTERAECFTCLKVKSCNRTKIEMSCSNSFHNSWIYTDEIDSQPHLSRFSGVQFNLWEQFLTGKIQRCRAGSQGSNSTRNSRLSWVRFNPWKSASTDNIYLIAKLSPSPS